MTDRNDALLPKLPEPCKQVAVAGYHDGTLKDALEDYYTADQMREYAIEALAAPAEGAQGLLKLAGEMDESASFGQRHGGHVSWKDLRDFAAALRDLIDSAGGAKDECETCGGRGWIDDGHEQDDGSMVANPEDCPDCTPQPAEGDGAEHDGDTCRANDLYAGNSVGWWKSKADNYKNGLLAVCDALGRIGIKMDGSTPCWEYVATLTRPAATAQVPEGWQLVPKQPTPFMVGEGAFALRQVDATMADAYAAMLASIPPITAVPTVTAQVPDGWKLVPETLPEVMRHKGFANANGKLGAQAMWTAMLASAPAAPKGGVVDMDAIVSAYNTWPKDLRAKLSLHDLRRMTGWNPPAPAKDTGGRSAFQMIAEQEATAAARRAATTPTEQGEG